MREIKFRAFTNDNEMIVDVMPDLRDSELKTCLSPDVNGNFIHEPVGSKGFWYSVPVKAIMQFTGAVIDDKEIYVDDIIELYKDGKLYFTGKVTDHGYHGCTIDSKDDYMEFDLRGYEYKLIGNVHENTNLL